MVPRTIAQSLLAVYSYNAIKSSIVCMEDDGSRGCLWLAGLTCLRVHKQHPDWRPSGEPNACATSRYPAHNRPSNASWLGGKNVHHSGGIACQCGPMSEPGVRSHETRQTCWSLKALQGTSELIQNS